MSRSGRPRLVRIYRRMLVLLPDDLSDRFGDEAGDVFADMYDETARERGGSAGTPEVLPDH